MAAHASNIFKALSAFTQAMLEKIVPRGFDSKIWIIFIGNLVNMFGQSMVWLFLTIYLNLQLGMSMTYIGSMFLVGTWVSVVFQVVSGSLCDTWGRKTIMAVGLALQAVIFLLLGLARDQTAVFVLFVVQGAVGSLYRPAAQAMIADLVGEERRVEAYGSLRVGANAGYGLGAMVGGFLASATYSSLFFVASLTNALYFMLVIIFLTETIPHRETEQRPLKAMLVSYFTGYRLVATNAVMATYAIAASLNSFVYAQSGTTFSVFAMSTVGITTQQIGYMWAMNAWLVVFLQMPIAACLKNVHIHKALAAGSVLYLVSFGILPAVTTYTGILAFMLLFTAGELVISPVLMTFVANIAPIDMRGRYMAFSNIAQSVGHSMGPFVGGRVMDKAPVAYVWYLATIGALASAALFFRLGALVGRSPPAQTCTVDKE